MGYRNKAVLVQHAWQDQNTLKLAGGPSWRSIHSKRSLCVDIYIYIERERDRGIDMGVDG